MSHLPSSCLPVVVLTNQTSPYQVEFMDAVARDPAVDLKVIYLYSQRPGRQWVQIHPQHEHLVLDGDEGRFPQAERWVRSAGLAVFSYYRDPLAARLIALRAALRQPWCFWGERMGVSQLAWAGPLVRRWTLRALHRSPAAIWGIGEFASAHYRREFGPGRTHCNVPYFSDLRRFACERNGARGGEGRTVLFSGSLITRKGVDTLADAFATVVAYAPALRLLLVGDGEERGRLAERLAAWGDRVEFAGFRAWGDLPAFYARADFLCVPSRHDGWALVVPEGLAAGLPVIGTRQTGAALELIHEGANGWLVEAGDATALAGVLREAAGLSAGRLETMSHAAVASVAGHQLADGVRRFVQAVGVTLEGWERAAPARP